MKQKGTAYQHYLPKVDYKTAKHAWFTHDGNPYSVVEAPASVFRSAVLVQSPHWKRCDEYCHVLQQDELDYQTRWWLLNCLSDAKRELRLYATREQAERACTEQVVG